MTYGTWSFVKYLTSLYSTATVIRPNKKVRDFKSPNTMIRLRVTMCIIYLCTLFSRDARIIYCIHLCNNVYIIYIFVFVLEPLRWYEIIKHIKRSFYAHNIYCYRYVNRNLKQVLYKLP